MVDAGKVLNQKRNCESFLPQVERALHLWFCEMRSKPHDPPINQSLLVQKSTLWVFYHLWHLWHAYRLMYSRQYCIAYKFISSKSSTYIPFNLLHSVHNIFDIFDMNYYIIFNLSALLRSLAIQIGRGMDHLLCGGLRGMASWTRQSVVAKSQPPSMMNWKPGRKWFLSPLLPGTHQMTFTVGMKLPCFTSCCLTGLIALMETSLQALQNIKTD